ncbi:MAG: branched-chain amino acid ABC transporter permease [Chloroflexi bacterium]|nr:branched-chain amino acid ABC transporter permease [Chloroflexota bacterium]
MVRVIFDTLSVTSILLLLVLGMAVIVGMMRIFNLCQGEFVLLGAVTAFLTYTWFGSVLLGILLAPIVVGAFGLLLERLVIRRFYASPAGALLATFAVGFVIREVVRAMMTSQGAPVPAPLHGSFDLLGASLPAWRLVIIGVTIVVVVAAYIALGRSSLGLRVRATLDNRELAEATGISTSRMYAGTYAVGAGLAGFAGALIVPNLTLYPDLGLDNLVPMFIAVMVGGLGSLEGPLLGAIAIGIPAGLVPALIGPVAAQVVVILGAIVFMRLRPTGLVSR